MNAPDLLDLKALREGAPILWMGEVMTFTCVGRYHGEWVVWLEEVDEPIGHDRWHDLAVIP